MRHGTAFRPLGGMMFAMTQQDTTGWLPAETGESLMPDMDDLLSKAQLAEELHVGVRTIERWIASGEAPPYIELPGGRRRWVWRDVVAWLDARRRQPQPGEAPE